MDLYHVTAEHHIILEVALEVNTCANEQLVTILWLIKFDDMSCGIYIVVLAARRENEGGNKYEYYSIKDIILFHDFVFLEVEANGCLHINARLWQLNASVEIKMVEIGGVE